MLRWIDSQAGVVTMDRISVAEAARDFPSVLSRVTGHGESLALEEENRVVAWLTPPVAPRECSVGDLQQLLSLLPTLGEDLESFARDLEAVNDSLAPESSPWE
jgi:antitoxin (DNA-binding transcriptional repressor) of toxin-antitoxin stability system